MIRPDPYRFSSSTVSQSSTSRRRFLSIAGEVGAAGVAAGLFGLPSPQGTKAVQAASEEPDDRGRVNQAFQARHKAALYQKGLPLPDHPDNGDDEL
jgi:hypothetical protein